MMILYRLLFCSLCGGGNNPKPYKGGMQGTAFITGIYYRQTSPLTAFFPFMAIKEGTVEPKKSFTQHYPEGDGAAPAPTIPSGQREDGGSYPIPNCSPKIDTHNRPVSSTPPEQLPLAATWCQQWILHLHQARRMG